MTRHTAETGTGRDVPGPPQDLVDRIRVTNGPQPGRRFDYGHFMARNARALLVFPIFFLFDSICFVAMFVHQSRSGVRLVLFYRKLQILFPSLNGLLGCKCTVKHKRNEKLVGMII